MRFSYSILAYSQHPCQLPPIGNVTFHPARLWKTCNNINVSATALYISRERKVCLLKTSDSRTGCSVTLPRGNGRFVNCIRLIRELGQASRLRVLSVASRDRRNKRKTIPVNKSKIDKTATFTTPQSILDGLTAPLAQGSLKNALQPTGSPA